MPAGRPLTLTPELCGLICQAIRDGNYREVAAKWAGVPVRTFLRWCARGKKEESGPYSDLWHAILEAEADAEIKMVDAVMKAAVSDPRHAQWWLERKFPERWSPNRGELRALAKQIAAIAQQGAKGGVPRKTPAKAEAGAKGGSRPD